MFLPAAAIFGTRLQHGYSTPNLRNTIWDLSWGWSMSMLYMNYFVLRNAKNPVRVSYLAPNLTMFWFPKGRLLDVKPG